MERALSLRQPWAELILRGRKTIETRDWNTKFRGKFHIHAAKAVDEEACREFGIDPASVVRGAIVGYATLTGVKAYLTKDEWDADKRKHCAGILPFRSPKYGFLLADVHRIEPVPLKGKLNFFPLPQDIL